MPWIYHLELSGVRNATAVQSDWQAIAGKAISNANGGVTVDNAIGEAIVVSTPREPNYTDMETTYDYVDGVSEEFEIPSGEVAGLVRNDNGNGEIVTLEK